VAVYGQGSGYDTATLTFYLDGPVSGLIVLRLSGLDDESAASNPFTFTINGLPMVGDDVSFPQWDTGPSPDFAVLVAEFPADAFVEGENTITIQNLAPNGVVNLGPYILLGEGTIEVR
jgi:hypothetical protein